MTRKVSPTYNFAVLYPAYAELWHPTKNHPLAPSEVMPGAQSRKYWWMCEIHGAYELPVAQQVRKLSRKCGVRCPECAKPSHEGQQDLNL